uniref:Uncharacterized protein n=1 Tax=Callorhinchus milii TaxID=7868 RepID=V9LGN9_CALMI
MTDSGRGCKEGRKNIPYNPDSSISLSGPVCIDLIDEAGNLMNLSDQQTSTEFASNYLTTQKKYILIQVKRDDFESCKYESLLKNLEQRHPELADCLQKLSNPKVKERNDSVLKRMRRSPKIPLTSEGKSTFRKQRKHHPNV